MVVLTKNQLVTWVLIILFYSLYTGNLQDNYFLFINECVIDIDRIVAEKEQLEADKAEYARLEAKLGKRDENQKWLHWL